MSKEDVNKALGIEDDATPYVFNQDGSWDYKEGMNEEKVAKLNAMHEKRIEENSTAEHQLIKAGKIINVVGLILAIGGFIASCVASEHDPYFLFGIVGGLIVYLLAYAISAYFKVVANTSNTLKEIKDKIDK